MAKVFTITEGLENMGALRTGGQGSVPSAAPGTKEHPGSLRQLA